LAAGVGYLSRGFGLTIDNLIGATVVLANGSVVERDADQLVLSSHRGRITSVAAFARLAGTAAIPASSSKPVRYRLDRSGDPKLTESSTRSRHTQTVTLAHDRLHRTTL
jgi:hypothetical protein